MKEREKGSEPLTPLINWDALADLLRPQMPPAPALGEKDNMWDRMSKRYQKMTELEGEFTMRQIECMPITAEDTVLDIGCGPGRVSVPVARIAKKVTSIDSSKNMLELCGEYAKKEGVTNLETRYMDWLSVSVGENLEQHDIAIACRSIGMHDIEKLSSAARKYAVIVIWANAPSIPEIIGDLFRGAVDDASNGRPPFHEDRRLGYNVFVNKVYDLGYDPNCRILDDGYYHIYPNREACYEDLKLVTDRPVIDEKRFHENVEKYLTENEDGTVTFLHTTRSLVLWWDTRRRAW